MARIRTIKPEFFKDEEIAEQLTDTQKLLWIGIWCLCDCEGKMEDRPKFIEAEIFPYNKINISDALNKLHSLGYIQRYEVEGKKYIKSKNFLKYQRPQARETSWHIPEPDNTLSKSCTSTDNVVSVHAGLWSMENGLLNMENGSKHETKSKISISADGVFQNISEQHLKIWSEAYPALNLKSEIAAAGSWVLANPKSRKSNWERFLVNWLKRSQDSARPQKSDKTNAETSKSDGDMQWSTIINHVKLRGSGQRCEGISDQARTVINQLGGMMEIGKCNDWKIKEMEKSFKSLYLQQENERKIT